MSKIYCSRIMHIAIITITIIGFVLLSQKYLFYNLDNHTVRVRQFYQEEENSLDVVFLGASEVYAGFSSAKAYDDYRFTSYPFVLGANPASLYKSQFVEVLKRQSPQVVLVEISGFIYPDDELLQNEEKIRRYVDNIPMSKNRLQTIFDVDYDDKLSCIIPFIKYHGISTELSTVKDNLVNEVSIIEKTSKLKGLSTYTNICDMSKRIIDTKNDNSMLPLSEKSEEYLLDFMEYCKSSDNVKVIFVRFPHPIEKGESYDCYCRSNTVEKLVKDNGFEYWALDNMGEEIGLDYSHDFYDENHLNTFGQKKTTSYLAKRISEELTGSPVELSDTNKKKWEESVRYTKKYFDYMDSITEEKREEWPYEEVELMKILDNYDV